MQRLVVALVALLAVPALAGCLSREPADAAGDGGGEPEAPLADPTPRTLYLAADGNLSEQIPASGSVAAHDFFVRWPQRSLELPGWGAPLGLVPMRLLPHNASVTLWLATDAPAPQVPEFPDVAVWFGSALYLPLVGSVQLAGPLLPGSPVKVTVPLDNVPERQPDLVLWPGWPVTLLVAVTMGHTEAHSVRVLVGGETPSQITFSAGPAESPGDERLIESIPVEGILPLFERVVGAYATLEGVNVHDVPFTVPANATDLLIQVGARSRATVDLDIHVVDQRGRVVTWGVSPYTTEVIFLLGEALAPIRGEPLVLRVFHHLGAGLQFNGAIEFYGAASSQT